MPRNRSKSVKLQTLVPQKYFVVRIKFVARSLAEKNQAWRRGFSSSIPEIRPVELASFLYYVARVTSRVKKGIAGNACAGRHKVYGGASSFAKLRRYRWDQPFVLALHAPRDTACPFFSWGGAEGLLRFVVAIERVWKLGGYFWRRSIFAGCFCCWGVDYKKGREEKEGIGGIEGIFRKGILNFKDWKGSVF